MGEVLASWPSPKYPNAMDANGITFDGGYIWIKGSMAESSGVLRCTTTGSLVNEITFPYHGYGKSNGLAFDGQYLWTIYHQMQQEQWDHYVRYTTTGSEVSAFVAHRTPPYLDSRAVTWDGQYIWTDERLSTITAGKYTTAGSLLGTFAMPFGWATDGAYYNGQIWSGSGAYIYGTVIGASTLVGSFSAPGGSCRAVGFDGEYLWTADANTPQYIYKVDIDVVDVEPGSFGKIKGMYR